MPLLRRALAALLLVAAAPAQAAFHLWQITEVYSNANGSVQYVEFTALSGGQQFLGCCSVTLTSSNGGAPNSFTFPSDLPGDTAGRKFLVGTTSFAALGVVTPDYIVPDNFLFPAGGTITFANGADTLAHGALPTDGVLALHIAVGSRSQSQSANAPQNFAGSVGSIMPPAATIPDAPTIGTAVAGNGEVTVNFTAPANDGGSAITGYLADCSGATQAGAAPPIVVAGLANGHPVTCRVAAINAVGTSPFSAASNFAIPAGPPAAPAIAAAIPGNNEASFRIQPGSDGGSAITGFTVTCNPGALTVSGARSPLTIAGLGNGTTYTCAATAANAAGTSPASAAANVTPAAMPVPSVIAIVSRRTHGAAGTFEVDLDGSIPLAGNVSVEPRSGATHLIAFCFNVPVTATGVVTATPGTATATASGNQVLVELAGIADLSRATVGLTGVNGVMGADAQVSVGFMAGDANGNRVVNGSDIAGARARRTLGMTQANGHFRFDVNADGVVDDADVRAVRARSGRALP